MMSNSDGLMGKADRCSRSELPLDGASHFIAEPVHEPGNCLQDSSSGALQVPFAGSIVAIGTADRA